MFWLLDSDESLAKVAVAAVAGDVGAGSEHVVQLQRHKAIGKELLQRGGCGCQAKGAAHGR